LWFVFALMTVAAIFAVLWPLSRRTLPQTGGSEAAVYKDQLAEIDRDVAADMIGPSEAEAARVEISRRLLAAVDDERDLPAPSHGTPPSPGQIITWGLPPSRTGVTPMPPRSGARCLRKRRPTRHGGRWFRGRWPGWAAVRQRLRRRIVQWRRPRT